MKAVEMEEQVLGTELANVRTSDRAGHRLGTAQGSVQVELHTMRRRAVNS